MGTAETLIIVGGLLIGGWCIFMGPCKEMFGDITSQISSVIGGGGNKFGDIGLDDKTVSSLGLSPSKLDRLTQETNFDEEIMAAQKQATAKGLPLSEQLKIGQQIGKKYKSVYDSYYSRPYTVGLY